MSETDAQTVPRETPPIQRDYGIVGHPSSSAYTDQDRIKALSHFIVLGNMARVSEHTGIPDTTLAYWRKQPWWNQQLASIRAEKNEEIDGRLTGAIDEALDGVLDNLRNGDEIVTKEGRHRVAMRGKDKAITFGILFEKRQLLRAMPTAITANSGADSLAGRMVGLLERMADKKEIDVTPVATQQADT